jgi:hypothetical protein
MPEHPGEIEYIDETTGSVIRRVPASEEPESIAFAPGPDGVLQPVTRITFLTVGDRREIRQFGADGSLLLSTYQRLEPDS